MRRIMLTVVAACAVLALVPASALAHGHRHHHARIHHRTFGHDWSMSANSGSTAAQDAGKVQSFTPGTNGAPGVLTIALNDGSTVSGQVTPDTEIECGAPETAMQSHDRGDDNGGGDDQGDDDNNENAAQNCDTSSLVPDTVVHEARLRLSGAGATWDKIELVTSATSSSSSRGDD